MTFSVVTTFSPKGYEVYGSHMIETFAAFWPDDVKLHVYYEGDKPSDASDRAEWHCLDYDRDRERFMAEHSDLNPKDYRQCPVRYSHKVFAMTGAPRETDHLIWLDSDCETFAPVKPLHLNEICAGLGKVGSYLGRPYARHSETGFLSFRMNNSGDDFLDEFRRVYTSGELFELPELHDCMAFDFLRRRYERSGHRFSNICKGAHGLRVFEQSPLKNFIQHHKGAVRKENTYGDHMIPGETRILNEMEITVIDETV